MVKHRNIWHVYFICSVFLGNYVLKCQLHNFEWHIFLRYIILLIAFQTSYLVEKAFSAASQYLGKQKLRMEIVNCGDLRLNLTNIQPDLEKIVSHHQVHPAHGKPTIAKEVVFQNSVTSKDI